MEIEKKVDSMAGAFEEFKKLNDKRLKEIEEKGFASSETISQVEKANKEVERLNEEVKAVRAALARSGASEQMDETKAAGKAAKAAFAKWMRKGDLSAEETKALSVQSDPDGGYLVMPAMSDEIVKKVYESSPVRQVASVVTISTDSFEILQDLDEVDAEWVGETASRPETDTPQLKKLVIPVHEMYAKPKASQKILDDGMINVEAWLAEHVAMKFARKEATGFVLGDGVNKPRGIFTHPNGTAYGEIEQINSGSAAAVTANGLISVAYALKGAYKPGAAWMIKRATIASIRKLVDLQGQYLWQPGLQAGQPDMLLGYPVYEADDVAAEGANALVAAFGNFQQGYQIVDRFGIRVLRDPYSAKPHVEFYTTKRVGGGVKNFEAIKILKCAV